MEYGGRLVMEGISEQQVDQLVTHTHMDEVVKRFNSDTGRFSTRKKFFEWLKKTPKSLYTLTDKQLELDGLIWLRQKQIPDEKYTCDFDKAVFGTTMAIRIFDGVTDLEMKESFIRQALYMYKDTKEYKKSKSKGVWVKVNVSDLETIYTFQSVGFRQVSEVNKKGKIIMIREQKRDGEI